MSCEARAGAFPHFFAQERRSPPWRLHELRCSRGRYSDPPRTSPPHRAAPSRPQYRRCGTRLSCGVCAGAARSRPAFPLPLRTRELCCSRGRRSTPPRTAPAPLHSSLSAPFGPRGHPTQQSAAPLRFDPWAPSSLQCASIAARMGAVPNSAPNI